MHKKKLFGNGQKQKPDTKKTGSPEEIISEKLLALFSMEKKKNFSLKEINSILKMHDVDDRHMVVSALNTLLDQKLVEQTNKGKYRSCDKGIFITGKVDLSMSGSGYIISEQADRDIFVSEQNLHHALDGDMVKVLVFARKKSKRLEGEVVEILKKARTRFVGILEINPKNSYLVTDNSHIPYDILIPPGNTNNARNGEKAIAEIVDWPKNSKNPIGKIVEVLGKPGENDVEIHAILAEYGLPYKFPKNVNDAANKLSDEISPEEIKLRRDFRNVPTFTIDPVDAKDFDDALSLQKLENGLWEVGVHIADVTFYVRPNTTIETEARERATSVYLVDRVVPMLPEKLSNNICSLRPKEDKLCYSAVFEIDDNAKISNEWFGRTIINSDRRFNYEEAQQIIETEQGDMAAEILQLQKLAKLLRNERYKAGAIDFERSEVKFKLDENGKPLSVYTKENKDSNKLIEEFMLLANRKVAEFIGKPKGDKKGRTCVYRVHDEPNPEKLSTFSNFVKKFGYQVQTQSRISITKSINNLLNQVQGKAEQDLIENIAIRSMAKAEYSTQNIGHYGLAFSFYTHFTSPIRRYPDMMVHRLLDHYLKGGKTMDAEILEPLCQHSSEMEQKAANAERASIKYKQVEFLSDKIGQVFEGVISGVTQWGVYVEIVDNKCEGMIPLRDFTDDYYVFDEENYCITGAHYKKKYQLGDALKIKVVKANLEKKQLDFSMVKPEEL